MGCHVHPLQLNKKGPTLPQHRASLVTQRNTHWTDRTY